LRGSCGQPGASFSHAATPDLLSQTPGRLYASRSHAPSPPHPLSQRHGGTASKWPVEAAAPDAGMDAPSKYPWEGARPHPLGKRFAFPTGAWTRFFEVQSGAPRPQAPTGPISRLHLSCLDEGVESYFFRWLDTGASSRQCSSSHITALQVTTTPKASTSERQRDTCRRQGGNADSGVRSWPRRPKAARPGKIRPRGTTPWFRPRSLPARLPDRRPAHGFGRRLAPLWVPTGCL
jgi:hypothetical protein